MAVLSLVGNFAGELNVVPRLVRLHSSDAMATILAAGYLDSAVNSLGVSILESDFIFVVASDGNHICTASIDGNGSIDLAQLV